MLVTVGKYIPRRLGLFAPGAFGVYGYERGRKKRDQTRYRAALSGAGAAAVGTGTMAAAMTPGFLMRRFGANISARHIEATQRARTWVNVSGKPMEAFAERAAVIEKAAKRGMPWFRRGTQFARLGTAGALAGIAVYGAAKWRKKKG